MRLYIGCPIWSFKGWVGNFYPEGTKPSDFLREYSRRLTTVEGNTTFYAVPAQDTLESWAAQMHEIFRFCPKVPKAISHEGKLMDNIERAREFIKVMSQLGPRLGPMFLQLPPRYSPKLLADLQVFLAVWPRDVRLAVEVRHLDWFDSPHDEALDQLLVDYNMARVTIDTRPIRDLDGDKILAGSVYQSLLEARERKPDIPVVPKRTADFVFVRYIGHPQLETNFPLLDEWAGYFVSQLREGADVYAFCHSPENMTAPWICKELHQRVANEISIAPLPWDEIESDKPEQPHLF
ncbi:MAG: DUF72 domain-containing protein [Anaerolineae bacterium]|nr:DUF72 domain-containing protein [Anaerolineae bacterium]MCI0610310.1 DUF72 domain-containing protein [Anaerolineae bacterium]